MSSEFYANAKILLTAEYAVLEGALALALPVKFGQNLNVEENHSGKISWSALENGKEWFSAVFSLINFQIEQSSDQIIAENLKMQFLALRELGSEKWAGSNGFSFKTNLNYNRYWGLGSSSTLIANLAQWAEVDPYALHRKISKGSGYDIACAFAKGPVFYKIDNDHPVVNDIHLNPAFADDLYFIYLGNKVDSAVAIRKFGNEKVFDQKRIDRISEMTQAIIKTENLSDFEKLIVEHEEIIASAIGMKRLKNERFPDFQGEIKSLGAWGGDFALIIWRFGHEKLKNYLAAKSIETVFCFKDFILQPNSKI